MPGSPSAAAPGSPSLAAAGASCVAAPGSSSVEGAGSSSAAVGGSSSAGASGSAFVAGSGSRSAAVPGSSLVEGAGSSSAAVSGVSSGEAAGRSSATAPARDPAPSVLPVSRSPRCADPVAVLLTAAEQLGTATRVCELAVQHAGTREQFGQPIGAFQAVKHLCAQMLVRAETARAAVYAAAVTADPVDVAAARLLADEAAERGARDCLQVHGGMGFTWECEVQLHLKRAWVRARRAGGGAESEELLAVDLLA
ncbi:acyl-CoA dehydrogenase family protein [Streptomyces canus]|uniref:acyl-CoA dehydrogenase family protein n=1 Tax=Streptomyces canus TaxID=58343 RepID=UPI00358F1349